MDRVLRMFGYWVALVMRFAAFVLGLAIVSAQGAYAANLITNGSFESGFTGWTITNVQSSTGTGSEPVRILTYGSSSNGAYGEIVPVDTAVGNPGLDPAGSKAVYFVSDFASPQTLSQTVSLIGGKTYQLGFDLYIPANGASNPGDARFQASIFGTNVLDVTVSSLGQQQWQTYSSDFSFVADMSGSLNFNFFTNSFPSKDVVLDRVYLTEVVSTAPEPSTWAMMLLGFGALGWAQRRKGAADRLVAVPN
jgi:hypothetical protein